MIRLNVLLLVLCLIYPLVNGVGFRGFTFQGLEEPEPLKKDADKDVIEGWITQPLDHFNYRDNRTWLMVIIVFHTIFFSLKYTFFS